MLSLTKKLTIRNEYTGREVTINPSKPLTRRKLATWRRKLHAKECKSGDSLGGRGPQADPTAYEDLLIRAEIVALTRIDE